MPDKGLSKNRILAAVAINAPLRVFFNPLVTNRI
jgi:hypothetical protein